MIFTIVKLHNPMLGFVDGNVQMMLNKDSLTPKAFLSPESAYAWAQSEGLYIDNYVIRVVDMATKQFIGG